MDGGDDGQPHNAVLGLPTYGNVRRGWSCTGERRATRTTRARITPPNIDMAARRHARELSLVRARRNVERAALPPTQATPLPWQSHAAPVRDYADCTLFPRVHQIVTTCEKPHTPRTQRCRFTCRGLGFSHTTLIQTSGPWQRSARAGETPTATQHKRAPKACARGGE